MWKKSALGVLLGAAVSVLAVTQGTALEKLSEGVYRVSATQLDDLLGLRDQSEAVVLVFEDKDPKDVFDAHIKLARTWVEAGGVLWIAGDALEGSIARGIAPFRVERFDYKRMSNGKKGGEMVMRGVTPRLLIHDHPLMADVTQLYLFTRYSFDGTINAIPLVEMTDSKGHHGLILAAISVGKGFLVLDGTARKGRLPGFDKKRPNSVKQATGWTNYDWDKLASNAVAFARWQR